MILVVTNTCNRHCSYCFEGDFTAGPARWMDLDDIDNLCDFFRIAECEPGYGVTLLGGEPTLHPDLPGIIDVIRSHNPMVRILLLTNLTCGGDLLDAVADRGVGLLVNLAPPGENPPHLEAAIERNFAHLTDRDDVAWSLSVTISSPDQDFSFLYARLEADARRRIHGVRIGWSAPGKGFRNHFVREHVRAIGETYRGIVERCHRINPLLRYSNECALNLCLAAPDTYGRLKEVVPSLSLVCDYPNMDILPDFSTHWCFAFRDVPELRVENIFDYPGPEAVEAVLRDRMNRLQRTLGARCDHGSCACFECPGPCPAINYYRAMTADGA